MTDETFTKMINDFFMVQAESTLAFAIIGSIFVPKMEITYNYFFLPLILSVINMLPCLPVYLMENMTIKQVIIQRIAELFILEISNIWVVHLILGNQLPQLGYVMIGVLILAFDILSYVLMWVKENKQAKKLNHQIEKSRTYRNKK